MNKRAMRLLMDGLLVVIILVAWRVLGIEKWSISLNWPIILMPLPLVWLGLRYGWSAPIVFGSIAGMINLFFSDESMSLSQRIAYEMTPFLFSGLAGIFAKYTQKTLNNKRYASTRLNIFTATLLTLTGYISYKFVLQPIINPVVDIAIQWTNWQTWVGIIGSVIVGAIALMILGQMFPSFIIPKRSPYLSRKETSRLLND